MIDSKKQGQSLALALHEQMSRPMNALLRRESVSKQRISKLTVEKQTLLESDQLFSPGIPRSKGGSAFHSAFSPDKPHSGED